MNTPQETWQENHERKLRLKSIFDEDRISDPELVKCSCCGRWKHPDEITDNGECDPCRREWIDDYEN